MFTEPVKKNSLSDVVAEKLQKLIASGKFKIGDQLPTETELMEHFGVGRSTIREAIRILSYSGILKVQQGVGTFVALQNGSPVPWYKRLQSARGEELNEVRQLLELKIAEKAAIHRTPAQIKCMQKYLHDRNTAAHENNIVKAVEADIAFHIKIAEACNNKILSDLYKTIAAQLKTYFIEVFVDTNLLLQKQELHEQLLQSIIDKDAKKAWKCVSAITYHENNGNISA